MHMPNPEQHRHQPWDKVTAEQCSASHILQRWQPHMCERLATRYLQGCYLPLRSPPSVQHVPSSCSGSSKGSGGREHLKEPNLPATQQSTSDVRVYQSPASLPAPAVCQESQRSGITGSLYQQATGLLGELLPEFTGKALPTTVTCTIHLP